jgi:hypothetical protein
LGGVHIGLRVRVLDTIAAYGYVSVTVYVLVLSSDSGFLGFGCPGVGFLLNRVSTLLTKYLYSLNSAFTIFCYTLCTHTRLIRSHSIFQTQKYLP